MRALSLLVLLTACKPVEEAPEDIDEILHALWDGYGAGEDATLAEAAAVLARLADVDALAERPDDGSQSRLTEAQQALVDLFPPPEDDGSWVRPDPALARPIYLLNVFSCTRAQLEPVLWALDQNDQYGAYDAYERTYTSSLDDFEAGRAATITWEAEVTASNLATGSYTELLIGGLRRVPIGALPEDLAGLVDDTSFVLARTHIPFPATTERDNVSFEQDYQIELYLPLTGGRMLHLYGIWRQLTLGALGDMENDGVARITLNNLVDWDDTTEALCAAR